jgi:hypothetical protein
MADDDLDDLSDDLSEDEDVAGSLELGEFAEEFGREAQEFLDSLDGAATPEVGNFSATFSELVYESLERVSEFAPSEHLKAEESFAEEAALPLSSSEFHIFSRGGNGLRNDWAALELRVEAQERLGQTDWNHRCNVFVHDVGASAGLRMPTVGGNPAGTDYWAAHQHGLRCWSATNAAKEGSVFSFNSPGASGPSWHHQGIVADPEKRDAISATSKAVQRYTTWQTDENGIPRYTQKAQDYNDLSHRAEVHFYDYICPDFQPFERFKR